MFYGNFENDKSEITLKHAPNKKENGIGWQFEYAIL